MAEGQNGRRWVTEAAETRQFGVFWALVKTLASTQKEHEACQCSESNGLPSIRKPDQKAMGQCFQGNNGLGLVRCVGSDEKQS